jgi:hypothetical protein
MPAAATGGPYSPPVQFIRQIALGNEASCHKLLKGREYIKGKRVHGRRVRSGAGRPRLAGKDALIYSLHPAIMAGIHMLCDTEARDKKTEARDKKMIRENCSGYARRLTVWLRKIVGVALDVTAKDFVYKIYEATGRQPKASGP